MTAQPSPPAVVKQPKPPPPVPAAAALVLTEEGEKAIVAARGEYEQKIDRLARLHCASTASSLVTAENVRQAQRLLEAEAPGIFWLFLDVVAVIVLGAGVNFVTSEKLQSLGIGLVVLGILLTVPAKLSTHWAPYSDWWRDRVRVRRR